MEGAMEGMEESPRVISSPYSPAFIRDCIGTAFPNPGLADAKASRAFVEFGGVLPADWRRISRVVDLTGLVHCLTHQQLPDDVTREIQPLIKSTLES